MFDPAASSPPLLTGNSDFFSLLMALLSNSWSMARNASVLQSLHVFFPQVTRYPYNVCLEQAQGEAKVGPKITENPVSKYVPNLALPHLCSVRTHLCTVSLLHKHVSRKVVLQNAVCYNTIISVPLCPLQCLTALH